MNEFMLKNKKIICEKKIIMKRSNREEGKEAR
jgi:hypothetical protein